MNCKKCKQTIPEGSLYCNHCGKKQETTPRKKTHKRLSGSGTIHKDIRYKKPFIALAPAEWSGKRRYLGAYATYTEAQAALDDYSKNGRPEMYNATLEEVYNVWSETHYRTIADGTSRQYKSTWKHFKPLYHAKIAELKTADYQAIIDTSYTPKSANTLRALIKMICDYAVSNDIVSKNYAEFIKLPKCEKREKEVFTHEQIAELWRHTDDKRVQLILAMIYMGFRIGEISRVTENNVHIEEGYVIAGEKTEAGKDRIIPFPPNIPEIADFFRKWKAEAAPGERLFDYSDSHFRAIYFYQPLIDYGIIKGSYQSINIKFADKNHITPHSTRHTFASMSADAGIHPEDLQKIIGHANYSTTADIYVHKDVERLKAEMGKIHK